MDHANKIGSDARPSTELAARRTGMSLQRTRMSADRTLMSAIRTALSLISFGFTIFQFFHKLNEMMPLGARGVAARPFGVALVLLGVAMLVLAIGYHVAFMLRLRTERRHLIEHGLIHGESAFPVSLTLIVAIALLVIGVLAVVSMTFRVGPFG